MFFDETTEVICKSACTFSCSFERLVGPTYWKRCVVGTPNSTFPVKTIKINFEIGCSAC